MWNVERRFMWETSLKRRWEYVDDCSDIDDIAYLIEQKCGENEVTRRGC